MLRSVGPDELMSLRRAADLDDAALDLALLRVGVLAPADLDEIRSLLRRESASLEPTRNAEGHVIIDIVERGALTARLQHDGAVTFLTRV
jgi:hypothetical protein